MKTMSSRSSWSVALLVGVAGSLVAMEPRAKTAAPTTGDDTTPLPVPDELTKAQPGGITADQAGARAAQTSWSAKASMENLRGAAARVDEAWAAFLPKLSFLGKYTRLSNFNAPSLFAVVGNLVGTTASGGVIPPADIASGAAPLVSTPVNFSFPFFLVNNWLFQATISVPISDYLLRTDQAYTAATQSQDAGRWDVVTSRAA